MRSSRWYVEEKTRRGREARGQEIAGDFMSTRGEQEVWAKLTGAKQELIKQGPEDTDSNIGFVYQNIGFVYQSLYTRVTE